MPAAHKPRIEMVPLIDTFFLLLAFFISSVLTMEVVRGLPVDLPRDFGTSGRFDRHRLLVTITEEGALQLEGETVTLPELRGRLSQHPGRDSLHVGLRGDRQARYEQVVQVLEVIRQAGISHVSLVTHPRSQGESPR